MTAQVPDVRAAAPPDPAAGSRSLRLLLALAAGVVVVAGLKAFSGSVGPAALALVLVVVVHPLGAWIQRFGTRRWVPAWAATWTGVLANLVVVYLIVGVLAASLAWAAVELATTLPQYVEQLVALRDSTLALLTQVGVNQTQLIQMINSADPYQLLGLAQTLVAGLTSGLTDFAFVLLLMFFLVLDAAAFPRLLEQAEGSHPDAVEAMRTFARGTRQFLVVSTVFGAVVAAMDVVALVWLDVPLALLWGLVSFVTNYIANVGFLLGVVPPALLALLANGPENALLVIIVYTVINVVVQGLVQPKIVGGAVGLTATLTFLSVVFWGFVLGGLGALLAVPLSLLARAVLVDADPRARWMLPLISGSPNGVPTRRSVRLRQRREEVAVAHAAPPVAAHEEGPEDGDGVLADQGVDPGADPEVDVRVDPRTARSLVIDPPEGGHDPRSVEDAPQSPAQQAAGPATDRT